MISGEYRGYNYWVRRTDIGIVTAYVDISRNGFLSSRLEGCDFSAADTYLDVHSGCTFLERIGENTFCDDFQLPAGAFVLGWDYGHLGDTVVTSAYFCWSKVSEEDAVNEVKTVINDINRRYDI